MAEQPRRFFSLADLIDYELQLACDSKVKPDELVRRDAGLQLSAEVLRQGKVVALGAWLQRVRGSYGARFLQFRQLLSFGLILAGAGLGWATIRGLLLYDGHHPVNVLPFLSIFFLLPLLCLFALFMQGFFVQWFGRVPAGWVSALSLWMLSRVQPRNVKELPVSDIWHRLKALHPQLMAWQAWILTQSFGLAYYGAALGAFLFYVAVHDYVFAWQTTLRIGPEALGGLIRAIAWPFAWLGSPWMPRQELIDATQYDRFAARYVHAWGREWAAEWWTFLAALIVTYGLLPRLLLLLYFRFRLRNHLRRMSFDDFASEEIWHRLQAQDLGWSASPGTKHPSPPDRTGALLRIQRDQPLMVVRWRQAPFSDDILRAYFERLGYTVGAVVDAEGRDSELEAILCLLKEGQALALVSDPWELPGEAFNRLRLAVRERMTPRTPILLVPLQQGPDAGPVQGAGAERQVWEASLKTFHDPYVGLLHEGSHGR